MASGGSVTRLLVGNPPNVAVPTHFYKVIFAEDGKIGGQVSLGAFVLPNARIANDKPLQDFEVPLEAVERYVICVDGLKIEHELTRFVEHLVLSLQRFFLRLRESRCARKSSVPSSSRITRRGKRLWQTRNHRLERRTFDVSKKLLLLDSCTIILYLFFWGGAQVQHHSSMHISYNWSSLSPSLLLLLWSCMS
jgi:hypothetical protein